MNSDISEHGYGSIFTASIDSSPSFVDLDAHGEASQSSILTVIILLSEWNNIRNIRPHPRKEYIQYDRYLIIHC